MIKRVLFLLVCILSCLIVNAREIDIKDSVFTIPPSFPLTFNQQDQLLEGYVESGITDSAQYYIAKARAVMKQIRESRKYIDYLDGESLLELPVGMQKTIGGLEYLIGISSVELKPTHAELEVYMSFVIPQNGDTITFAGKGIKFSQTGGIMPGARLELVSDYGINLSGDKAQLLLKGGSTFVSFTCDGFEAMGLDAEVKFSREMLVPESDAGEILPGQVQSAFKVNLTDWNDLVVELSLPSFQVSALPGFGFSLNQAVFDFSDIRNATTMFFPEHYQSSLSGSGSENLWRGFYARELSVRLPAQFKSTGTQRQSFSANYLIIDNRGVSGVFTAEGIIPIDKGKMGNWAFSLDSLSIDVAYNQVRGVGFKGGIVLPVSQQDTPFAYKAVVDGGSNYQFHISPTKEMSFPLWQAGEVEIYDASYLDIKVVNKEFLPKANLHGRMNINAGNGIELAEISFENLEMQTVRPYVHVGSFSFGSDQARQKLGRFPVTINNVGLRDMPGDKLALDFDLLLNLVGESNGGFTADAGLSVIGSLEEGQGAHHWKYDDTQVSDIGLDIDGGAYTFKGKLVFFKQDAVYGNGFNGNVDANFKLGVSGIEVKGSAIFGNVNSERYWYVDALSEFATGIPIAPGFMTYGFGGGAYYKMTVAPNKSNGLGATVSGVNYQPELKNGLGLKASMIVGSPSKEAFNADIAFEVSFFQGGGIRAMSLSGNGKFMAKFEGSLDKIKNQTGKLFEAVAKADKTAGNSALGGLIASPTNSQSLDAIYGTIEENKKEAGAISARVFISYDFPNKTLHGNLEVFVDVANGLIQGVGANSRAGWAVLHFDPQDWYIYIGTPADRIGLKAGIGPLQASLTSYFVMGSIVPGSPPPAENVSRILGGIDLDYMRDENLLRNAGGFGFGAAFAFDTGDLQFLMFYARFAAGAGFDIMIKNYGDVHCKGKNGTLGINGWYANGQAYAFFEGDIGISVRLFGRRRKVEILSIAAAAVLQAKLPNPIWMRGIVGGRFRVLGGLVKGNCKFEVTVGEECEIVGGNALEGINVIAQLTPANGEGDVNVFNAAQAIFTLEVGKEFELVEPDDSKRSYRIKLDFLKIKNGAVEIPGTIEWNYDKNVAAFNPVDILPSQKKLTVLAQVSFEEKTFGIWRPVMVDGKPFTEYKESTFTSGIAPDYIPLENVQYSYPVVGQYNYYKDESNAGYIKLRRGQPELFQVDSKWVQRGRIKTQNGQEYYFTFRYSNGNVSFGMPAGLTNNELYAIEIVNLPVEKARAIDSNVKTGAEKLDTGNANVDAEIRTVKAEGTVDVLQEKSIFTSYFRTSIYNTFVTKLASLTLSNGWTWPVHVGVHEMGVNTRSQEPFDYFEINGGTDFNPLVGFETSTDNAWFKTYCGPLVYPSSYPVEGLILDWRRPVELWGVPPVRAGFIVQDAAAIKLDMNNPAIVPQAIADGVFTSNFIPTSYRDFVDLRNKAAVRLLTEDNAWMTKMVTSYFTGVISGDYPLKVQYKLPGTNTITSERLINIHIQ